MQFQCNGIPIHSGVHIKTDRRKIISTETISEYWTLDTHNVQSRNYAKWNIIFGFRISTAHGSRDKMIVCWFFLTSSLRRSLYSPKEIKWNVRVIETLSRSPKWNPFDECIVIVLTIAVRITSIHSLPSTVNLQFDIIWWHGPRSEYHSSWAFGFQLTGMYLLACF